MEKIILKREDTLERITWLAYLLWYNPNITTTSIIERQEEPDEDGTPNIVPVEVIETKPNPETPTMFVSRYYQKMIDDNITEIFLNEAKRKLEQQRKLEDLALNDEVKTSVGNTVIIEE